jgi:hypothetical protein
MNVTPYIQENNQFNIVNTILKTMLQQMTTKHKPSRHTIFSTLWAYHSSIKTTIGFTHFYLTYGIEAVFPIEYEIPSLLLAVNFPSITMSH